MNPDPSADVNETINASWRSPKDIKLRYPHASFLAGDRVIFNIKGRSYRLVVIVRYVNKAVLIEWVGTHAEYNKKNFS